MGRVLGFACGPHQPIDEEPCTRLIGISEAAPKNRHPIGPVLTKGWIAKKRLEIRSLNLIYWRT